MAGLPTYLLKAPEDDLRRWKAAAVARGQTFAAYTRDALDARTSSLVKSGELPHWLLGSPGRAEGGDAD